MTDRLEEIMAKTQRYEAVTDPEDIDWLFDEIEALRADNAEAHADKEALWKEAERLRGENVSLRGSVESLVAEVAVGGKPLVGRLIAEVDRLRAAADRLADKVESLVVGHYGRCDCPLCEIVAAAVAYREATR